MYEPKSARVDSRSHDEPRSAMLHRGKLQGVVGGNWFARAGVCTAVNGWSIPADKFQVGATLLQPLPTARAIPTVHV